MNGRMDEIVLRNCFMTFVAVFQSYRNNDKIIMKDLYAVESHLPKFCHWRNSK